MVHVTSAQIEGWMNFQDTWCPCKIICSASPWTHRLSSKWPYITLRNNSATWLGSNGVGADLVLWQWLMMGSIPSYPDSNKNSRNSNCMLSSARNVTLDTLFKLGINKSGGSEEYFRKSSRTMCGNYSSHIRDVDKLLVYHPFSTVPQSENCSEKRTPFHRPLLFYLLPSQFVDFTL